MAVVRQEPSAEDTACLSSLKQVSLALLMYSQDYDELLPPMQTAAGAQKRLMPYVKNSQSFTCPATMKAYKANPAVGGKAQAVFAEPAKVVTFYDAVPHTDGKFTAAYLDGHVLRETKVPALAPKLIVKKPAAHSKKPRTRR